MVKEKVRKSEKRKDANYLSGVIRNVKKEIDCLQDKGGDDCKHRLDQLRKITLPKLECKMVGLQA